MNKRNIRLISLLLAIIMITGMLEAPLGLLGVNAVDTAPPVEVYYNNDFTANADGITFSTFKGNVSKHDAEGGYLYLRASQYNDPVAFWNKDGNVDLPDQFVVSFDLTALEQWAAWELHLVDENGNYIRVLSSNGGTRAVNYLYNGGAKQLYGKTSTADSIQWVPVTLVFDMAAGTYTLQSKDYYENDLVVTDLALRGSGDSGTGEFGTVQYIAIESRGDDTADGTTPRNIIIDNLKIYSGSEILEELPEQPDPTEPPPADSADVYYNNDFAENADGITFPTLKNGAVNHSKHDAEGERLYLRAHQYNDAVAFWNKGDDGKAILELPAQFVVSFDFAVMETWPDWELRIVDEQGRYIRVLSNNGGAAINYLYSDGTAHKHGQNYPSLSTAETIKYHTITLKFDMAAGKYSYKYDNNNGGVAEKADLLLRGAGDKFGAEFGTIQYFAIEARGDDKASGTPGNLLIDNLKIYGGTEELDTVGPQNKFPGQPDPSEPTTEAPTETPTETPTEAPTETPTEPDPTEPDAAPDDVYYNNDFSENADGISIYKLGKGAINYSKHDAENEYLYLRAHQYNDAVAFWNKGADGKAVMELPEQFVVSFDFAVMDTWPDWELRIVDEEGRYIRVLSNNGGAAINYLYSDGTAHKNGQNYPTLSTDGNMKFFSVALAFDQTTGKYSYKYDNNNGGVVEKKDLLLRGSGDKVGGEFGTIQYIAFESRGDDKTDGTTPGNLIIDNLKVYGGTSVSNNVGPQNKFPAGDEEDTTPVDVYYNNDFAANADGLTIIKLGKGSISYSEHNKENGNVYLRVHQYNGAAAIWNKALDGTAAIELPKQFVFSFDHAAVDKWSTWELRLVDENGNFIRVMSNNGRDGALNFLYYDGTTNKATYTFPAVSTEGNIKYHPVALKFDMAAGTYSVETVDSYGNPVQKTNLKLRGSNDGKGDPFGTVQYIEFLSRGDDTTDGTTPGNLIIDNLKVYSGTKVRDDVGPQNKFPAGEEEPTDPVKVYFNNNFAQNIEGITLASLAGGSINYSKQTNGYLYLRSHQYNYAVATWNMAKNGLAPIQLPDQFVLSFDHAAIDKWSTWELRLIDEYGNYIRVISNNGRDGALNFLYYDGTTNKATYTFPAVSTAGNIKYHPVALKFDMAAGTFSFESLDSNGNPLGKSNLQLRSATNAKGEKKEFGTLRYIEFLSRGDDTTDGTTPGNLIIDNMKIYSGKKVLKEVGPQDQFQQPLTFVKPDADPGNYRYYDSGFEDEKMSIDDLVLQGGAEFKREPNGNRYVNMLYGARWSFNFYRLWDLTDYMVAEFSVKTDLTSTYQVQIYDTADHSFVPISLSRTGDITPAHDATVAKLKKNEWVNMAVAINSVDKTYSVWYEGVLVVSNDKIPNTDFGTMGRIVFTVPYGDMVTAKGGTDNLKVYQGFSPADYKNTVLLKEQPMDESYLEEWMGKESPIADYATEELAIIKSAGAVMVNTNTLYIYSDGKRTQGTQAQVDAIVKNTAGKKVIKNNLGLVVIGPNSMSLTDEQIASLHDYMIYVRPTAATLQTLFKSTGSAHPRVILTPDRLTQLRSAYKNNATIKELGDRVIRSADLLLKTDHIKFTDPSFTTLMNNRYQTLSMAYLLTKDARYKDYLFADIEGTAKFANWRTHEYLATATAAFGVAIAYDWLYDAWTPAQRKVIEGALYKHVLYHHHKMVYNKISGTGVYIASDTNRNAVCNGGVGMACIALFDVYPEKCADIMEKNYHLLEIGLDDFAPSGATTEGPAYWDYLMQYLVPFLQTSFNAFGTDFNLMDAPGFSSTVDYILDIDGMTGVNNFHDSAGDGHLVSGEIFGLATMLGRPDLARALLAKMEIYRTDDGMDTMLYMDTSLKYDGTVDKALDGYYDGMEVFSMRSSWTNSAGIFVSAHSGKTGISHDHLDSGTFVLDFGGQRFASDIGKEDYNIGAVNELAYYYYRKRPEGHNMFVINPDLKKGEDLGLNIGASDVVSKFVTKDRGAYAIMPLDSAYAGYAQNAARGIMLGDDRKSVLIRDEIRGMTLDTNEVWWFMQMENVEVEISADGKSAILSKGGVDVHMQIVTDAKSYEIKVLPAKEMVPLAGLPGVDKQTPNTNYTRLAIVFKTGKDVNINVKFAELGNPKGDTPIKDVALANWSIPDGVLVADPVLDGIEIGGVRIPGFKKTQSFYNFELPYGTKECPDVRVIGGEGCTVDIKKPKYLPDYLTITVTSNANKANQTKYRIYLTVSGPISVQVSATPEPENHGRNMLDGNLGTRWAIDSAGWAKFTFPSPQMVDAIWLASWYQCERVQPFNIEVSEDGVNFKEVWNGTTTLLEEGERDRLQEFKIPAGMYKSIRLNVTSAQYPDGRSNPWTSILEVMFYYQGKPIEIILQTSDPDTEFNENPNENIDSGDKKDPITTEPNEPDVTEPSDMVDDSSEGSSGVVWLIVGLCVAAALVAGAIVFIVIKKKKAAAAEEAQEQPETPADAATE